MKALLLKGANRRALDNEGRIAATMVGAGVPENMRGELELMLVSLSIIVNL